jgi:hypothetical protein
MSAIATIWLLDTLAMLIGASSGFKPSVWGIKKINFINAYTDDRHMGLISNTVKYTFLAPA